jgi:zinc transporter, ZIP family
MENKLEKPISKVPFYARIILPLVALGLMISVFAFGNPLAIFRSDVPPAESIHFDRIRVTEGGFSITLTNDGPSPVTVAQVSVDAAYWDFQLSPSNAIPRYEQATLTIPYPWVHTEPYEITILTDTGLTFSDTVDLATLTPTPGLDEFMAYGLVGIYVGIIPVALGMLWFPAMRRMGRKWLGSILALTIGLLVFLLIDTFLEALEVAGNLSGFLNGVPLTLFIALLAWMLISAIGANRSNANKMDASSRPTYLAGLIALSIGLHNLGEGLVIGAAFALGEAALGSFLVIGFTMHNITEGIGIVAPLVSKDEKIGQPKLLTFVWLALLAGAPAIIGAWIGGFAYSPLLATIFLGVGLGAIWQVIVEVGNLLKRYAQLENTPLVSWPNLTGFLAGIGIMYATALLVSV